MGRKINLKKIGLYILISFGFSWFIAGIMKFAGIELGGITSTIILGVFYMSGPAIATFGIQKFIYNENFKKYGWQFEKKAIKWLLVTPLLFLALFLLTFAIIGLFGNLQIIPQFGQLDFSQEGFTKRLIQILESKGVNNPKIPAISSKVLFFLFIVQGIIAGITVNIPFMFGEEFGWRGLLLEETRSLGFFRSSLFIGFVWGIWHLPIILMGHNYPSNPPLGVAMMCLFTISISPLFAYVRIKAKSILSACMLHGMINATGTITTLYVTGGNEFYSSIAGWAGVIAGFTITAGIYLFDKEFIANFTNTNPPNLSPKELS